METQKKGCPELGAWFPEMKTPSLLFFFSFKNKELISVILIGRCYNSKPALLPKAALAALPLI